MSKMNINKAIKKEKKRKRNFLIVMITLFIILPIVIYATGQTKFQFMIGLIILEFLIILAVIAELNMYSLKFICHNNRLKIQQGLMTDSNLILCDTVRIVHTEKKQGDINIIIITNRKVRNKYMKVVGDKFLKRHEEVYNEYRKMKRINPDTLYYRTIIRAGGVKKYLLLKEIYSNCVKAVYTASAIESIKIARGYKEIED